MSDLAEIFDAVGTTEDEHGNRHAPCALLPDLLDQFEKKRGIILLNDQEKDQLRFYAAQTPDLPIGPGDLIDLLGALSPPPAPQPPAFPSLPLASQTVDDAPSSAASGAAAPPGEEGEKDGSGERLGEERVTRMLTPEPSTLTSRRAAGSPSPATHPLPPTRANRPMSTLSRTSSSSSLAPTSSSRIPISTSSSSTSLHTQSHSQSQDSQTSKDQAKKKRLSSFFSGTSSKKSPEKDKLKEHGFDAWASVLHEGTSYLGTGYDGAYGKSWNAVNLADRLRDATKGMGTRESPVIDVLADKTFAQVRSINEAYLEKYGKTLVELFESEGKLKSTDLGKALRGIAMGPLNWDVELVRKATDSAVPRNDHLLIELLIGRSPSSLSLLRAAYSRRYPPPGSTGSTPLKSSTSTFSKTRLHALEDAVAASYSGNAKMKKVWEVALMGRWEDEQHPPASPARDKLVMEDVDQLKVALRSGHGNAELTARILLARSPDHLHAVLVEFKKQSNKSLTKAIKDTFEKTHKDMFLHAVEGAKNDRDGSWRDAKLLMKAMKGAGTADLDLTWRIVRAHWDRPRFLRIQAAFKQKYKKPLAAWVKGDTSGYFRDVLLAVVETASLPEPTPTQEDLDRLADAVRPRSRSSSISSRSSSDALNESGVLEGSGEMEQPPSPRSPPMSVSDDVEEDEATPMVDSFRFERPLYDDDDRPSTPSMTSSLSASSLASSTSSTASVDSIPFAPGHKHSSSLSARVRSSPLETAFSHKPASSAAGSGGASSKLPGSGLRHARPVAPSRRRTSGDQSGMRSSSTEPMSPSWDGGAGGNRSGSASPTFARSPTPSSASERAKSPSDLPQTHYRRRSGSGIPRPLSRASTGLSDFDPSKPPLSPPPPSPTKETSSPATSGIDTTSYHAPPISPVRDNDEPDTQPLDSAQMPNMGAAFGFPDLQSLSGFNEFFDPNASPERASSYLLRRENSTASTGSSGGGSRPGSLFYGEGMGSGGTFRPDSMASIFPSSYNRAGSTGSGSGDQTVALFRYCQELQKKLKDSDDRYQSSSATFEQEHSELESRLEEARAELQVKRREEKELRSTEKTHLAQIASLESDIAGINKRLEKSRELFDQMKKNYQDQCEEAEKLRKQVNEIRKENRALEESAQNHALQVQQFDKDCELLQSAITKLEEDLGQARRAQDALDHQKQENMMLRETIDRLRFDMDEMRGANRKSRFLDGSSIEGSDGSSLPGTMSRNLGLELARRLGEKEVEEEGSEIEGESAEEEDIVVTTHRRVKKRASKTTGTGTSTQPRVTILEETTTVSDADIQTDVIATTEMDIQTDLTAISEELVLASQIPKPTEEELRKQLASGLGIDLAMLETFVDQVKNPPAAPVSSSSIKSVPDASTRRIRRGWHGLSSRMGAVGQAPAYLISAFPPSARPFVGQVLESTVAFTLYSVSVFLMGFITGVYTSPFHRPQPIFSPFVLINSADGAEWNRHPFGFYDPLISHGTFGQLGLFGGVREGVFSWVQDFVWRSVSTARRFPV
ncbi:hypothetical protein T439DRAFT_320247 [Meredithblackwellia eburnea MCA 4105]